LPTRLDVIALPNRRYSGRLVRDGQGRLMDVADPC